MAVRMHSALLLIPLIAFGREVEELDLLQITGSKTDVEVEARKGDDDRKSRPRRQHWPDDWSEWSDELMDAVNQTNMEASHDEMHSKLSKLQATANATQEDVADVLRLAKETNDLLKSTQGSSGGSSGGSGGSSGGSSGNDKARDVLIIHEQGSDTFDTFGALIASSGGRVYKKLLDELVPEDMRSMSIVMLDVKAATSNESDASLVADWYNEDTGAVLVVLVEVGASLSIVEEANAFLASLSPATNIRVSDESFGPRSCSTADIVAFGDPFFQVPLPPAGITSTAAYKVTGEGRALLNIEGNTIARLDNYDRLLVIGTDDLLSDNCFGTWTTGNDAFVNNLLAIPSDTAAEEAGASA